MIRSGPLLFAVFALSAAAPLIAVGEEAVERHGKKHMGRLLCEHGVWLFRTESQQKIAAADLAHVRFDARPTPLPKAPLRHVLHLPGEQRITGTSLSLDAEKLVFAVSWGKTVTLKRADVTGIEHANDSLPILHDDFEADAKSWQATGKPTLDPQRPFFGKSSLRLDGAMMRTWPPLRDGAIRFFFHDPAKGDERCSFEIIGEKPIAPAPSLVLDARGYSCRNVQREFGSLKQAAGWHMIAIETAGDRLRFFFDDYCLGETTLPANGAIKGLRIMHGGGRLCIDEFGVARKLKRLAVPMPMPGDQDSLILEQGEQLFGQLTGADSDALQLQAKFGKRSLPWTRSARHFFCSRKRDSAGESPDDCVSPRPGFCAGLAAGQPVTLGRGQFDRRSRHSRRNRDRARSAGDGPFRGEIIAAAGEELIALNVGRGIGEPCRVSGRVTLP